eukprot:gnl/MRDRNA2_/MRDRNA2_82975_c0_seq1.p1 gnl/MRDRNA2_/MRDRNA2_82975_c0~~gnl/MRDRNA2_/MRDRNA2_82975_c0_seq1.p1  ORF type:complete len:186 (-),score=28.08 gnl/MRDRNA2_/MRDRNA2_82975_c0_seq1:195-671(-)
MASIAIFVTMALCVSGSVTSDDQDLQELKSEIWAGFKKTVQEVQEKMDTYDASTDFKEFAKPFGEKHGAGIGPKIQEFKQNHPEADVSPQSLISLSTEQTDKLKTGGNYMCSLALPVIHMIAGLYCPVVFSWNLDVFNIWACYVSLMIPINAICTVGA